MNELSILPLINCFIFDSTLQDIWLIKENGTLLHLIKRHKLTHILIFQEKLQVMEGHLDSCATPVQLSHPNLNCQYATPCWMWIYIILKTWSLRCQYEHLAFSLTL